MKTLMQHIEEKLIIFPSQVNERLVINKYYKSPGINNTIYDAFKNDFQWISHSNKWGMYENLNNIVALDKVIRKKLNDIIRPRVPKDRSIFVHYVNNKKTTNIFYDMLDLLDKKHDEIDFLCDDEQEYSPTYKMIIKIFETNAHIICIVGPKDKSYSNFSNTVIIFAYK